MTSCIKGGAFSGMIDEPDYDNTEKLNVGGNISQQASENIFIDAQDDIFIDAGVNIKIEKTMRAMSILMEPKYT